MTWMMLQLRNGKQTCVNISKVVRMDENDGKTRIYFNVIVPDEKGEHVFKSITVVESIETIAKALKARPPG